MQHPVSRSSGSAGSKTLGALLAALIVLVGASGAARAKKRVVVLGFDGAKAASAEAAVADVVERKYTLVSASAYARAAKRLKARKSSDKNIAKIAKDINADAIVAGAVKRKGNRWTLSVTVREGKTGKTLDTLVFRLSGPKVGKQDKKDIAADLLPAIGRAKAIAAAAEPKKKKGKGKRRPVEEAEEEESEEEVASEEEEPAFEEAPVEEVASAETTEETSINARAGEGDAAGGTRPRTPGAAADLSVGMSFISRDLGFNYAGLGMGQEPPTYGGDPVPGIYVSAMIYPFAFVQRRGAARNLGVSFVFDRVFTLTSNGRDLNDGMDKSFSTVQQRWGLGLRYRLVLGTASISAGLGYNRLAFQIERGMADLDMPNVAYEYVDLGAVGRLPFGRFALFAGGAYLVMLAAGEIEETTFYGSGTIQGVEAEAGLEVKILPRLIGKVGGRYQRIAYDFDGTGMETTMRDGDSTDQDVGGALDEYLGGYVTVGYLF